MEYCISATTIEVLAQGQLHTVKREVARDIEHGTLGPNPMITYAQGNLDAYDLIAGECKPLGLLAALNEARFLRNEYRRRWAMRTARAR